VVTPRGRLLVRAICMVFDRYLRARAARAGYSKVI
jgi:oxygen-independent coproporphyrinogen-3 oxidase